MVRINAHDMAPISEKSPISNPTQRTHPPIHPSSKNTQLTRRRPRNTRIRTRLIIRTPTKHPNILPLATPILHEILLRQALRIHDLLAMMEALPEALGASEEDFGVVDFPHGEAALDEVGGGFGEGDGLADVGEEVYLAGGVGAVDVGEFEGGAGVAAVEEDG